MFVVFECVDMDKENLNAAFFELGRTRKWVYPANKGALKNVCTQIALERGSNAAIDFEYIRYQLAKLEDIKAKP